MDSEWTRNFKIFMELCKENDTDDKSLAIRFLITQKLIIMLH